MAYTTINKPTDHFNTKLYTGTGAGQTITGVGFQPDLFWIKQRSSTQSHLWWDAVRGGNYYMGSNHTNASNNDIGTFTNASDGYSLGTDNAYNGNGSTYVGWNWRANGSGSANTDGTINSTVSVNTTAGFSIVSYTGTGSNATVGHGLGAVPKMIIIKNSIDTEPWIVYHTGIDATAPEDYHLRLNTTDSRVDETPIWNDTAPTSSVFSLGSSNAPNGSGDNHIAYCFADKTGYSKFGSYSGNQNTDGTFVYTGFKPAFLMIKRYSTGNPTTTNWQMFDSKRLGYNVDNNQLQANLGNAEGTDDDLDILSNGFKLRGTGADLNNSGHDYIYMAFAEAPLVGSNNVPCTAR